MHVVAAGGRGGGVERERGRNGDGSGVQNHATKKINLSPYVI